MLNLYRVIKELNDWPINTNYNFTIKNCLFGMVKITSNTIIRKFICDGQGIVFDVLVH